MFKNSDDLEGNGWVLLYGPPKSGKTVCAATISEQCPEKLPADGVILHDVAWFLYDKDGTEALKDVGLNVPVVDFSGAATYKELLKMEKEAIGALKSKIAAGETKTLVIDTLTARDFVLTNYFGGVYTSPQQKGMMFGAVKDAHQNYAKDLLPLDVRVIVLAHAKEVSGMMVDEKAAATKQAATQLPGFADIRPAMTGSIINWYRGTCSYIWPVRCKRKKGVAPEYTILTSGNSSFEGGSRGSNRLDAEEPANLKNIFKKLGK